MFEEKYGRTVSSLASAIAVDGMFMLPMPMWWYVEVGPLGDDYALRVELTWWDQCPYKKRPEKAYLLFLHSSPCENIMRIQTSANKKIPSTDTTYISTLILDFLAPELWEISACCLSHTVYGIFVAAAQTDENRNWSWEWECWYNKYLKMCKQFWVVGRVEAGRVFKFMLKEAEIIRKDI